MIKIVTLLLLSSVYLFSAGFWTLTGLEKANIYLVNQIPFLDPKTVSTTKEKMTAMLHKLGIETDKQDSPTLMITFSEIDDEESHYVYIQLALGEEVQTFRKNKNPTFALTFVDNDFIDVDSAELDKEILNSVDALLYLFTEQFKDDKE